MDHLLTSEALDKILRYPGGRSARMARKGLIPHIVLPDGEIRFDAEVIEKWLTELASEPAVTLAKRMELERGVIGNAHSE